MHVVRSVDGTEIAVHCSGSGPPLLLVHGTGTDHTRWRPVLPSLDAHFTVYGMDRRGRGSSGDAATYDIEREYEDLAVLIDSIGGEPVDVVAHSYGAICALGAAPRTARIGRLVLYEPPIPVSDAPSFAPELIAAMERGVAGGERESVLSSFYTEILGLSDREIERMRAAPDWASRVKAAHTLPRELASLNRYRLVETSLRDLAAPTLLLLGGDSQRRFRTAIEGLHAILPRSEVVMMAGQQHMAMSTAPALFTREVLAFLKR